MALTEYNKKRSFKKTTEPKGQVHAQRRGPLHFVVQKHDASHLHYDFRLELDGVLKSWAVPKGPSLNPEDKRLAVMTEDHPLSYATFEGEIPKGEYGAGDVIVWDYGVYASPESADPEESRKKLKSGLFKGELKFVLFGEKLKGGFALVKMKGRQENAWLLVKERDAYATSEDITEQAGSVLSDRVLPLDSGKKAVKNAPPKAARMPHDIQPMLATLVDEPFDRDGWFFETKWDGYRAIAEIEHGRVKLYSRKGNSFVKAYPPVVGALKQMHHDAVLDGEIVAMKEGRADFHALQLYGEKPVPLVYELFDLLYLDGYDLRARPLVERKELLKELLPEDDVLKYSEHVEKSGKQLFAKLKARGIEGVVAKDARSPYREGKRTQEWLKIKSIQEQEAIIVGFTEPRGARAHLGALVLGAYDRGALRYIGHSGGGFTDRELADLYKRLSKIRTSKSPFDTKVPVNSPMTWVTPKYVCEIRFTEWTPDGCMRHPIYAGLRVDKKPHEVIVERAQEAPEKASFKKCKKRAYTGKLELTHLDKVFWPDEGYTKGDLIDYYDQMAETLLPYLRDRPQNLNRHPNGIKGKSFYQKNITAELPDFVETTKIWSDSNNGYRNYLVCNNKETLLYMANLGCIELNPWNSRTLNIERPDYVILDLDPHGRPWSDVAKVAQEVRSTLDLACEYHFPKTSGKTGLHVIVPVAGRYRYEAVRNFAELIMRIVHTRVPDITSLERTPGKRDGKMYLDYLQNRLGQTLACAYSVRPYPGATVSTPLSWDEVTKELDPSAFTIKTMFKRLANKGDLWKPVLGKSVDLADAIRCLQEKLR